MNLTEQETELVHLVRSSPESENGHPCGVSIDEVAWLLDISKESARDVIVSACDKKALRCEHTNADGSIASKEVGWSASPVFYLIDPNARFDLTLKGETE